MSPEASKAFKLFLESLGLNLTDKGEETLNMQHGEPLKSCFGDCMPLNLPMNDPLTKGITEFMAFIGKVQKASYIKDEKEIKIEIVIELPKPATGGKN